ncbi:SDR family NAD(P)-dependent oxidoreductase [Brevibacillus sp. NPDC003359]|uniref:SDR family NAD(P)-dependent oxidoreductase n=1 Tax=unclassified Brevibacillus TaxID=2684853 RepID=UPI003696EAB9
MSQSKTDTFLQRLRHSDYFVQDHRVHGICTLPGVVLLDMVYRLSASSLHTQSIELRNVVFKQPIVTSEQFDVDIFVSFTQCETYTEITVSSSRTQADASTVVNMECQLYVMKHTDAQPRHHIPILNRKAQNQWDMDEVYAFARKAEIQHFSFMKTLGTVFQEGQHEWMELQVSRLAEQYLDKFYAHAALLDGSTFAGTSFRMLGSVSDEDVGFTPYIPFTIERFVIHSSFPAKVYTYTERTHSDMSADADIISRSIAICNEEGKLLAEFINLKAKRIREQQLITGLIAAVSKTEKERSVAISSQPTPADYSVDADKDTITAFLTHEIALALNTTAERIDIQTGFYELGMDSIQLLEFVKRLENKINAPLYPTLLFEYSTVETLTNYLQNNWKNSFRDTIAPHLKIGTDNQAVPLQKTGRLLVCEQVWEQAEIDESNKTNSSMPRTRIVVLYNGSEAWKTILEHQSSISQVIVLHPGSQETPLEWLQKFETVFSLIQQQLQQHPDELLLQVVADSTDQEGYVLGLEGLLRTAVMEHPRLLGQIIKMDISHSTTSGQVVAELLEREAFYASTGAASTWYTENGLQRHKRRLKEVTLSQHPVQMPYKTDGVYLITGGMGGLGYELARHISNQTKVKLALIGRSVDDPTKEERVKRIRENGSEAVYVQADITNQNELEQAVDFLRTRWGRIDGVFHCAGVVNDQWILKKSLSDLEKVLQPKIQGLWNLDQTLQNDELDLFVTFSSISAILGNLGQADYASANAFMDQLAMQRQLKVEKTIRSGRTFTINWPLWAEGGMQIDEKLRHMMQSSSGMTLLPTEEGMQLLDRVLSQHRPQLAALYGEESHIRKHLLRARLMEDSLSDEGGANRVMEDRHSSREDIAIIGVAGRYPLADNLDEFYQNLKEGKDCITAIPKERWRNQHISYNVDDYYHHGGFLNRIDNFDPGFFSISPYQAEMMDPQARLFLQTAWEACEDAGFLIDRTQHDYASSSNKSVGVFAGVFWNHYELFSAEMSQRGTPAAFGVNSSSIPNMVSYHLNFHGPSMAVDSMCSSSLTAIHLACESIKRGECHYAIAGGVNLITHPHRYLFLKKAKFLSTDGKCRSFGKDGDGYVPGEGVGAVLITTVAEAEKQGYPIYAVIKSSAINHAGRTSGTTVPDPVAQSEVIKDALSAAGIDPTTITYMETHGTGTSLGDPIEVQGLERAFQTADVSTQRQSCAIGSLKSNIGHLEAAAGIASLTKLLLQFKYKEIFPSLHAEELNPFIPFESTSFYVERSNRAWKRQVIKVDGVDKEIPLRAGVSSFGASGSNAHLIMEEYVPALQVDSTTFPTASETPTAAAIVPLSAKNEERLKQYMHKLLQHLLNVDHTLQVADLAYTFQTGRVAMNCRAAFVASNVNELIKEIKQRLEGKQALNSVESEHLDVEEQPETLLHTGELSRLADLWAQGKHVNWIDLNRAAKPKLLHAPTYPFAENSYWVPAAKSTNHIQIQHIRGLESGAEDNIDLDLVDEHDSEADVEQLTERVQTSLTQMAAKLLKVKTSDIDADVDLSEYGFDSILFTELTEQLNRTYKFELTPTLFFERTTVRQVAAFLVQEQRQNVHELFRNAVTTSSIVNRQPITGQNTHKSSYVKTAISETDHAASNHEPIAVIGMSAKFPMADDVEQFWENLVSGKDCISEVPKDRWDWETNYGDPNQEHRKTNVKWGGFIDGIGEFDPLFFGISPREATHMDPQQRLLMMYVWKAIEDAGYSASSLSGSDLGLFIGTGGSGYNVLMAQANEAVEAYSITANVPSVGPNRMSHFLDVHGPSQPIETSCSSSLVAIHRAILAIRSGDCSMAVVGGVNTILSLDAHVSLNKAGMLSKDGRCKTFSEQADGYGRGEGVGMIVLKRLSAAEMDGDQIYGIIRSSSENHGGRAGSLTSPNPKAQTALLKTAYAKSSIDPASISFIEAHGTGTPLGDPIEINALKDAFQPAGSKNAVSKTGLSYCGIGSVKTNIGHLEMAAGIAGVIKILLQLKHKKLVKSLHVDKVNPYIQLDGTSFYIVQETKEWNALTDEQGYELPRRAGVSSFGFGGSNAHVVLEEYIPRESVDQVNHFPISPQNPAIIVLSAKNKERLHEQVRQLMHELNKRDYTDEHLGRIAYTLQTGREAMDARVGFIVTSIEELKHQLKSYLEDGAEASDVFEGNVQQNREMIAVFRADEELKEAVEKWIKRRKYAKLLGLWVKGLTVDWNIIYGESRPQRMSLPTYPFSRQRYWVANHHQQQSRSDHIPSTLMNEEASETVPREAIPIVLDILADLLGVKAEDLNQQTPLSEYGMDSIQALQLQQRLQTRFGSTVSLTDILAVGTIEELIDQLPKSTDEAVNPNTIQESVSSPS